MKDIYFCLKYKVKKIKIFAIDEMAWVFDWSKLDKLNFPVQTTLSPIQHEMIHLVTYKLGVFNMHHMIRFVSYLPKVSDFPLDSGFLHQ